MTKHVLESVAGRGRNPRLSSILAPVRFEPTGAEGEGLAIEPIGRKYRRAYPIWPVSVRSQRRDRSTANQAQCANHDTPSSRPSEDGPGIVVGAAFVLSAR